jgi:polar amino acid transport system substrate-binding protein
MRIKNSRAVIGLIGVAAIALSIAACGSEKSTNPTAGASVAASATADAKLVAMLPAAIKSKGTLTIGTDSTYPPNEYLDADGKTVIGFDVDLFNAVAKKLGLRTSWQSASFDNIIPGVTSGKYDIGVSSFTINADRVKQVDMISYFTAGYQWVTAAGTTIDPNNACGKSIAVQTGTVEADDLAAKSKACTAAGNKAITIHQYQAQDDATSALISGKDQAMSADLPVSIDAVDKSSGKLALDGKQYSAAPYGYAIAKNNGQFGPAIQGAVQDLINDGTYTKILTTWKVASGAIPTSQINPAS